MPRSRSRLPTELQARKRPPRTLSQWKIDRRSVEARELAADLMVFVQDLGGFEALSAMEVATLERLCFIRRMLMLHESAVLAGKGAILEPGEHAQWTNTLLGLLRTLGLARRAKNASDLTQYLAARAANSAPPAQPDAGVA